MNQPDSTHLVLRPTVIPRLLRRILALMFLVLLVPVLISAFAFDGKDRNGMPMWWLLGLPVIPWTFLELWNLRRCVIWDGKHLRDRRFFFQRRVRHDAIQALEIRGTLGAADGLLVIHRADRNRPMRLNMEPFMGRARHFLERLEGDTGLQARRWGSDGTGTQQVVFRPGRQGLNVLRGVLLPLSLGFLAIQVSCQAGSVPCGGPDWVLSVMAAAFLAYWLHAELVARRTKYELHADGVHTCDWRLAETSIAYKEIRSVKIELNQGVPHGIRLGLKDGTRRGLTVTGFRGGDAVRLAQALRERAGLAGDKGTLEKGIRRGWRLESEDVTKGPKGRRN